MLWELADAADVREVGMAWLQMSNKRPKRRKARPATEEALAAQFGDGLLDQILDSTPIMICRLAPDGTTRFANRAAGAV